MTLAAGSRLGPYEILSPLGAGGMGEVYKAKDTRLERTVAVKVLPSHMSASPEVRQRFEREAKTISQLSHPHICALYDVGREGETEYLVMEYLEGETLTDRLSKGALSLEQTVRFGSQIADALDKAHRQGIVHRDLKPANVMITKSGVKLLDFGLAKAMATPAPQSALTSLPTQHGLTQEGTILGTFQYMAPEQLEGKEADGRTDLFAFGAVLYEMATGRKAFSGASQASLISAIMTGDPPSITSVQPLSPPALDRVVRTCLAKDPEDRWQSAHDVASELKWIGEGSQAGAPLQVSTRRRSRERLAWTAAALLLAACAALLVRGSRRPEIEHRISRFSLAPPVGESFFGTIALSPDGRWLGFTTRGAKAGLWLHSFESGTTLPVADSRDALYPFWSPDGKALAFFAGGKLKKTTTTGTLPQIVCEVPDTRGGSWGPDGQILFSASATSGLFRVPSAGGAPAPFTTLDSKLQENSHRWPLWLPDDRHYLFVVFSGDSRTGGIFWGTPGSPVKKRILPDLSLVAVTPDGYLLFRRQALMAQRFDADRGELSGEPFVITDSLRGDLQITGLAVFSVSKTGVLTYRTGAESPTRLVWVDRAGKELTALPGSENGSEPALSPDGKRVAWDKRNLESLISDVWSFDFARETATRLTFDPADDSTAVWSPDGDRIVFTSVRSGTYELYEKPANGATPERLLLKTGSAKYPDDWSRDGKFILYEETDPKTQLDLWLLPLPSDQKPAPYLRTPFNEAHAQFSPDGKWIAYVSDEAGEAQVYVQSVPVSNGKWQISKSGGDQPAWRPDGKELFYLTSDRKMMAVPVTTGTTFEAGVPQVLFDAPVQALVVTGERNYYAVSADGQRFLLRKVPEEATSPVTIVLDWTAGLPEK